MGANTKNREKKFYGRRSMGRVGRVIGNTTIFFFGLNIMKEISVREMTNMVKLACVICRKHFSGQRK